MVTGLDGTRLCAEVILVATSSVDVVLCSSSAIVGGDTEMLILLSVV